MPSRATSRLIGVLRAVADLALPLSCAACGRPGVSCCPVCLAACAWPDGPRLSGPVWCPPGLPPTWAAGAYDGPLRRLIVAYKDEDRRDLLDPLAGLLAVVLDHASWPPPATPDRGTLLVVPVPTAPAARRRRGDAPLSMLLAAALGAAGDVPELLSLTRRVADQAGLGSKSRAVNLAGAFRATARGREQLAGVSCLLVDDVLTTGATLAEAARAVAEAGGRPVAAAVLAATVLHTSDGGAATASQGPATGSPGPVR